MLLAMPGDVNNFIDHPKQGLVETWNCDSTSAHEKLLATMSPAG
jgi:hypothetical protein